jgi:hypothetical protein
LIYFPENDRSIESQPRLRTVPLDEFHDGVIVGPLAALRRKGVENGRLCLFQIGQGEDRFGRFLFFRDLGIGNGLL